MSPVTQSVRKSVDKSVKQESDNIIPFQRPTWIGIDPGMNGGIVSISDDEISVFSSSGRNHYDIRNWLEGFIPQVNIVHVLLEQVGGFIGQTEDGQKRNIASAHTMFILGQSFGWIEATLACARLSYKEMRPQEWQKRLNITPKQKGEKPHQFKGRLKKRAQELFPEEKITLSTCDAFLLAYLCRSLNK